MAVSNLKGISFPFRRGPVNFPETNSGATAVLDNVKSLLLIGLGEVPMGNDLGTTIHSLVFNGLTPIESARIVQSVRSVIAHKEPRMQVLSVDTEEVAGKLGSSIMATITWKVGDDLGTTDVPIST